MLARHATPPENRRHEMQPVVRNYNKLQSNVLVFADANERLQRIVAIYNVLLLVHGIMEAEPWLSATSCTGLQRVARHRWTLCREKVIHPIQVQR